MRLKDSNRREYKFATLTIVAEDTPIVLAIEPVRDKRWWETDDVTTTSRGEIVDRLLKQAQQHVDIHKVFADREFDGHAVRVAAHRHDVQYIIGKRESADKDSENIVEIKEDAVNNVRVEHGSLTYNGNTHDVSFMYIPIDDKEDNYAIFVTNAWVSPDRAIALAVQYRQRWIIENEYKTIKKHYLPTTASTDYRIRFLYFTVGVMMFNVWRLANFILRDTVNINLGENPPVQAGEIIELIAFCLFDPGD